MNIEKIFTDANASPAVISEILADAKSRGIEYFVHFTQAENLPSIAEHGLMTRQNLDNHSIAYQFNDSQRLDNLINSLSLSVTFPNYQMFYSLQMKHPSKKWAVILLDAEKILSKLPCAFNKTNAANSAIKNMSKETRMTLDAFKRMFEGERKGRHLRDNETTDPQAEVICLADIPLEYFKAILFTNTNTATEYQKFFPNVTCNVDNSYFTYRHDWVYWKKSRDYDEDWY